MSLSNINDCLGCVELTEENKRLREKLGIAKQCLSELIGFSYNSKTGVYDDPLDTNKEIEEVLSKIEEQK